MLSNPSRHHTKLKWLEIPITSFKSNHSDLVMYPGRYENQTHFILATIAQNQLDTPQLINKVVVTLG